MKKQLIFILSFLIMLSISTGVFYFFVISSTGAKKPYLEKPAFDELMINSKSSVIESTHVAYVANEIGAYKLHKDIRTGNVPEIEFYLTDTDDFFTLRMIDGKPDVEHIASNNPDMRFTTDQETLVKILTSQDIGSMIAKEATNGKIKIELLADEVTLGMKGYKAVYDELSKNKNEITGNYISTLNPVKITIFTKLIALLSLLGIIEIVYLIEK